MSAATAFAVSTSAADDAMRATVCAMAGLSATPHADQLEALKALVCERGHVLVVQATGWGKSAVYWAATRALRDAGAGPTLVVSPLLALMGNQIEAASRAGLTAITINSATSESWEQLFQAIHDNTVDVVLISPERLSAPSFRATLERLRETVGLVVIDEAHCLSDWGFDFRPDYQRITTVLLAGLDVPVLATTATANARVTRDVAELLGEHTHVLRGPLARTSLRLSVIPALKPLERWAWVSEALPKFDGSGIVYCLTVADTNRLSEFLQSQGHNVAAYNSAVATEDKQRIELALRANELKAVVATSALGMGYDKPDLSFCIHVGSPASPIAYYQQVGRAGRALDNADAVLLPSESDERIWEYFATSTLPDPSQMNALLDALAAQDPTTIPELEATTGIRRGKVEHLLKIASVDGAAERRTGGWISTGSPWVYNAKKYDAIVETRKAEAEIMADYAAGRGCLQAFLLTALDDDEAIACGRCSVCTGLLPAPGAHPSSAILAAAGIQADKIETVLEARKLWPKGTPGVSGRIKPAGLDGRALGFSDAPGWGERLTTIMAGPDKNLPDEVLDGLIALLARWSKTWGQRPGVIVPMPSRSHPRRVKEIAYRLGTIGRIPVTELLEITGDEQAGSSSADGTAARVRAEHLLSTMRLRDNVTVPSEVVLLIDDQWRTGWTATVASYLLQRAGTGPVLPLAVHSLP